MNQKISFLLLVSLLIAAPVFAQYDLPGAEFIIPQFSYMSYYGSAVPEDEITIPEGIRNNRFYLESMRLTQLAHDTFEFGDYDASAGFAEEAIRFARLSDEFVAEQLIAEAKRLLDWADSNNIATRFPIDYNEGKSHYEASVLAHSVEEWDDAISSASRAVNIFARFESNRVAPLPRQYTVRTWAGHRDCLWNIAGYPWVYGDPWRWRELYNANRSRLPDPNNPNIIEPGMVLDIPSIRGEERHGMWDPTGRN
jgi:hypothetical protein